MGGGGGPAIFIADRFRSYQYFFPASKLKLLEVTPVFLETQLKSLLAAAVCCQSALRNPRFSADPLILRFPNKTTR